MDIQVTSNPVSAGSRLPVAVKKTKAYGRRPKPHLCRNTPGDRIARRGRPSLSHDETIAKLKRSLNAAYVQKFRLQKKLSCLEKGKTDESDDDWLVLLGMKKNPLVRKNHSDQNLRFMMDVGSCPTPTGSRASLARAVSHFFGKVSRNFLRNTG